MGLPLDQSARYSFLASIPALTGASLWYLVKALSGDILLGPSHLIGGAVAFGVSLASIHLLLRAIRLGYLPYFGPYCLLVGLASLVFGIAHG